MTQQQIQSGAYHRTLLDALPLMVFVVDDDMRVLDMNRSAEELLGGGKLRMAGTRGGDVLHCIHSLDVPDGCGRGPHCGTCAIRSSVQGSFSGTEARRRRTKFHVESESGEKEVEFLITTTPFLYEGDHRTLLLLEDISELTMLRGLIPICAKCKKIRGDDEYWKNVEHYFNDYLGVDFTHGLCPDCIQDFRADWSKSRAASGVAAPLATCVSHSPSRRSTRS